MPLGGATNAMSCGALVEILIPDSLTSISGAVDQPVLTFSSPAAEAAS